MIEDDTWIKLYRRLLDDVIWKNSTPEQKVVLIALLLKANHSEREWEFKGSKFRCNPGQFVTSLDNIANSCGKGITIQNVRSSIKRFEKLGFLTNESTSTGRLITIVNWGIYQCISRSTNKVNNKEPTINQQSSNKDLTPNKNNKNKKKKDTCSNSIKFDESSDEMIIVNHLLNKIREINPGFKEPNKQMWAKHVDYMLRLDNRDKKVICKLINLIFKDGFWRGNILSTSKLRSKYDQLCIKFREDLLEVYGIELEVTNNDVE